MTDLTDLRARAEALLTTRPGVDKYQQGEPSDALCCEDYDVLVGPGGYVDFLGEPEDRSWCRDAACAVARLNELHSLAADLLAALPPDPAPTGERRPCPEWEEEGNEWVMCAGAFLLVVWVRECKDDAGNVTHGWRVNDGDDDVAFCAYTVPLTLEAAQLAAEDAAAELLTAGLRALGRVK